MASNVITDAGWHTSISPLKSSGCVGVGKKSPALIVLPMFAPWLARILTPSRIVEASNSTRTAWRITLSRVRATPRDSRRWNVFARPELSFRRALAAARHSAVAVKVPGTDLPSIAIRIPHHSLTVRITAGAINIEVRRPAISPVSVIGPQPPNLANRQPTHFVPTSSPRNPWPAKSSAHRPAGRSRAPVFTAQIAGHLVATVIDTHRREG